MILQQIKAGSLQLVTFIIVIIALLLMSFILLIYTHKQYRIKTDHIIETVKLADRGINYALSNTSNTKDTISVNLLDAEYKKLTTHKSYWGTFEKLYSKASVKNNGLSKICLVGSKEHQKEAALYLKDNNKPLVLVGHTKIDGKAFLPKRGVKSGNISGTSYYNEKYVYGSIEESKQFPLLNTTLLSHIEQLINSDLEPQNTEFIDLKSSKVHTNSFLNPMQLFYSKSDIFLSDIELTGHIIIESETKITIDARSKLQDVILVAPIIDIKPNVNGVFQAFAKEKITVAKNVALDYPSALALIRDYSESENNEIHRIEILDNATVKGNILVLGKSLPNNYEAQIKIWPNAIIKGIIYCEQNLELRGTVLGTVYTHNFIIKEDGSIYQNHLYNAKISSDELEPQFVGLSLINAKKSVAKWLY